MARPAPAEIDIESDAHIDRLDDEFGPIIGVDHELQSMIDGEPRPSRRDRADHGGGRLAELRTAGLIRHASEQDAASVERSLPVSAALRPLLAGGCLRRGSTVAVPEATSLLLTLVAEASAAGSWCAVVGLPQLGMVAAAEAGIAVERFALVPHPGPDWASVAAALIDGVDIVVIATSGATSGAGAVPAHVANRLTARARQRGTVLVAAGRWPGAEVTLDVVGSTWHGLRHGRGRLRTRELEITAHGRGAAARTRRVRLWLPDSAGAVSSTLTPALTLVPPLELAG